MPLEVKDVSYRYGKKSPWIIRDAYFTLNPGEVTGIFGPSGCGKSTLARIATGYEKPVLGQVTLGGCRLKRNGFNPVQLIGQHPEKAVNPRWRMNAILSEGWKPDERVISALGIEKAWLNRWSNELSGGELQRFCVARSLSPETRYLVADEITTMLDAVTQAQIWEVLLDHVKSRKIGLLAISHDRALLERICGNIMEWELP